MNTVYIGLSDTALDLLAEKNARIVGKYIGTRGGVGQPIYLSVYAIQAERTEVLFWENRPYIYQLGDSWYIFTSLSAPDVIGKTNFGNWTKETMIAAIKNKISGG